ncbi:MAG: DUF1636 domain-containing protein [Blastochloris viridis]|uniref:DUF1636 domain-containing protein n=1 Tax=Blastochloris viridis TaxID=1079 RepID=A0A6N4R6N1_BLAVI|nr:MAG: DUF1636 domain-containing protein [Blastochloris viridis]
MRSNLICQRLDIAAVVGEDLHLAMNEWRNRNTCFIGQPCIDAAVAGSPRRGTNRHKDGEKGKQFFHGSLSFSESLREAEIKILQACRIGVFYSKLLVMSQPESKKSLITLYVCAVCDRNPSRLDTAQAQGYLFLRKLRHVFKGENDIKLKSVKCLGGCECNGKPNGCCSVGLTSANRHSYVLNQLDPQKDIWKIIEFLRLYRAQKNGRIYCKHSIHADVLRPHVATRIPGP